MLQQMRRNAALVAEEKKRHAGMALEGDGGAGHYDGWASVSSHGVKGYGSRCCHDPCRPPLRDSFTCTGLAGAASTAGAPKDDRP